MERVPFVKNMGKVLKYCRPLFNLDSIHYFDTMISFVPSNNKNSALLTIGIIYASNAHCIIFSTTDFECSYQSYESRSIQTNSLYINIDYHLMYLYIKN